GEGLRARGAEELPELLGEVEQDRAAFEHAYRLRAAAVDERGDLRIGVHLDEAARELAAFADPDRPGVILRAGVPLGEQLLEHDPDLLAIGRREPTKPEWGL